MRFKLTNTKSICMAASWGCEIEGYLDSALHQPQAMFSGEYLHSGIFEMAGAYLFHIVKNHPFIDGNKRTATVCTLLFLKWNGISIDYDWQDFGEIVFGAIDGSLDKKAIADRLKNLAH
ncbi:MAG: type II toxin-antitoxin system death-on-curing family toxin [Planctomycetota bacterium]